MSPYAWPEILSVYNRVRDFDFKDIFLTSDDIPDLSLRTRIRLQLLLQFRLY